LPHDGLPCCSRGQRGKTTTIGKVGRRLVDDGHEVVMAAGDTFRAAAAEQLATWGERAGATVVRGPEGADPASVAFDAVKQGDEEGADVVLLDTAGRLHTKTGLMDELGKVKRVVSRQALVDEVLLVLDATTVRTAHPGVGVRRRRRRHRHRPHQARRHRQGRHRPRAARAGGAGRWGLGEGPDDLAPFEPAAFVDALLSDEGVTAVSMRAR
jgi:fused signal recognition particle receptor